MKHTQVAVNSLLLDVAKRMKFPLRHLSILYYILRGFQLRILHCYLRPTQAFEQGLLEVGNMLKRSKQARSETEPQNSCLL